MTVRRSLPLFVAIVASLAISQIWLTWQIAEKDQRLAAQRAKERLDQTADLALDQLADGLASWELSLREWEDLPRPAEANSRIPPNATLLRISAESAAAYPAKPLLFVPHPPGGNPPSDGAFAAADKLEFQDRNAAGAIEVLRPLTKQAGTRAEALLRIARLERKLGHLDEARYAYNRMLGETGVGPGGAPYSLIAMAARCEIAVEACDAVRGALLSGRWLLGRDAFEYYWQEMNRSKSAAETPPKEAVQLAALVARLDDKWRQGQNGRSVEADGSLLLWQGNASRLLALVVPAGWLDSAFRLSSDTGEVRWRLAGAGPGVRRSLADLQLPGAVEFYSVASGTSSGVNRALWFAGVVLMLLFLVAGSYAIHRGVSRELQVAQLQSDFVSAVSHEFRSPLTSLRGIGELLVSDRISDEARKRQSYLFLEHETTRLQKMGCAYRSKFDRILANGKIRPGHITEFSSVEAIKRCVAAGMGLAVLPAVAVSRELHLVESIAAHWAGPSLDVVTHLSWHRDKWISPSMAAFRELVMETRRENMGTAKGNRQPSLNQRVVAADNSPAS